MTRCRLAAQTPLLLEKEGGEAVLWVGEGRGEVRTEIASGEYMRWKGNGLGFASGSEYVFYLILRMRRRCFEPIEGPCGITETR